VSWLHLTNNIIYSIDTGVCKTFCMYLHWLASFNTILQKSYAYCGIPIFRNGFMFDVLSYQEIISNIYADVIHSFQSTNHKAHEPTLFCL
jgi:cephalosporin hydroxylase